MGCGGVGGDVRGLGTWGAWDMGPAKRNMELDKWDMSARDGMRLMRDEHS